MCKPVLGVHNPDAADVIEILMMTKRYLLLLIATVIRKESDHDLWHENNASSRYRK